MIEVQTKELISSVALIWASSTREWALPEKYIQISIQKLVCPSSNKLVNQAKSDTLKADTSHFRRNMFDLWVIF